MMVSHHAVPVCILLAAVSASATAASSSSSPSSSLTFNFSIEDDLLALNEWGNAEKNISGRSLCIHTFVGVGYGRHALCDFPPLGKRCFFLSFGVQYEYSFERDMFARFNCTGLSLDPSVTHPVNITPGSLFLKAGAHSTAHHPADWHTFSVPELRAWADHPLYALKMDCEGCEYSLAKDILQSDPRFFDRIFQFNIEVHTPRVYMTKNEHAYDLGRLYRLLNLAGMRLQHADNAYCAQHELRKGFQPLLKNSTFDCYPGCQSFLFARPDVTYATWLSEYHRMEF